MTEIGLEKRFSKARDALAALKSGNIQGANLQIATVRKIAKPRDSRIQLSKSARELNIKIPSTLVRKPFLVVFRGILFLLLFAPIILFFALIDISIAILVLALFMIIANLLVQSWGYGNKITFNREYFTLEHQIFGESNHQVTGYISQISGTFIYGMGAVHQISIGSANVTGTYFYTLVKNLTEAEAVWLAQEIQDWLDLR